MSASLLVGLSDDPETGRQLVQCELGQAGKDFEFEFFKNYECYESIRYNCRSTNFPDANSRIYLWIDQFKFELQGDDSQISNHAFSKNSTECPI